MRTQYAGLGRQIVTRAFERAGRPLIEDRIKSVLPRFARASVEDVLAAVGRGELYSGDVLKAVYPDIVDDRKTPDERKGASERKVAPLRVREEGGWFSTRTYGAVLFHVPGVSEEVDWKILAQGGLHTDLPVHLTRNGGAVPGDRIVGILEPGRSITIYPIQSPDLTIFDDRPDLWLDARWDIEEGERPLFPAKLKIAAINEPGTLGVIATVIGENGANIDNVVMTPISPDWRDIVVDVEVLDLKHLSTIVSQLRARTIVNKVERVNG